MHINYENVREKIVGFSLILQNIWSVIRANCLVEEHVEIISFVCANSSFTANEPDNDEMNERWGIYQTGWGGFPM